MENNPPRRHPPSRGTLWFGLILVCVGIVLILERVGHFSLHNWWALFILIPAFSSFRRGWQAMQATDGQFSSFARRSFIGGLVLTVVAVILLFNLDWVIFGPILLIVAGAAMLISSVLPK